MSSSNRANLLTNMHKVLKKHYKPMAPAGDRTLLEHLLMASILENARPQDAEAAFEYVKRGFFDLNEVRVTTVRELAEGFRQIPDAEDAAGRMKAVLQSVFEDAYSFDIEALKKINIGQAVKKLEKFDGTTQFTVAYATQVALGGHAIPLNHGAMTALLVLEIVSEADAAKWKVPGMERAIPKSKGIEFGSLLHQFGVDIHKNPYSPEVRKTLLEIDPECKERLPKRPSKKTEPPAEAAPAEKAEKAPAKKKAAPTKKAAAKPAAKKKPAATPKKAAAKKPPSKRLARRKPR